MVGADKGPPQGSGGSQRSASSGLPIWAHGIPGHNNRPVTLARQRRVDLDGAVGTGATGRPEAGEAKKEFSRRRRTVCSA
jgi:hypothetical protein